MVCLPRTHSNNTIPIRKSLQKASGKLGGRGEASRKEQEKVPEDEAEGSLRGDRKEEEKARKKYVRGQVDWLGIDRENITT